MKIYRKLVLDFHGNVVEEDAYEYHGPVAEAKGGGGGGGESRQVTTQELAPEQRSILKPVIPVTRDFVTNPPTDYPGSRVAPFNATQLEAQGMLSDAARGSATDFTNYMLGNQRRINEIGLNPASNPALPGLLEAGIRPLTQNLTQSVLPRVRSEAVAGGQFGGSRQGIAEGMASQAYFDAASDVVSNVLNNAYTTGLENATRAQALAPTLLSSTAFPAQLLGAVGEQQYAQEQAQLNDEVNRYFNEQLLPFLAAKEAASVAFGMPTGVTTSELTAPGNSRGGLVQGLGGAATGAGLGLMLTGGNPIGAGVGAGIGGLGSIFF